MITRGKTTIGWLRGGMKKKLPFFSKFFFRGNKKTPTQSIRTLRTWAKQTSGSIFSLSLITTYTYAHIYTYLFHFISSIPLGRGNKPDLYILFNQIKPSFMARGLWKLPLHLYSSEYFPTPIFNQKTPKSFHILWGAWKIFPYFYTHIKKCIFLPRKCLPNYPVLPSIVRVKGFMLTARDETKGQARLLNTNIMPLKVLW